MSETSRNKRKKMSDDEAGIMNDERFQLELEFVQCLASPQYLQWLSQTGWFNEPGAAEFLKYLLYWKQPEYAKHLIYPNCLKFLEMLQDKNFRKSIAREETKELVHCQQFYAWMHYRKSKKPKD